MWSNMFDSYNDNADLEWDFSIVWWLSGVTVSSSQWEINISLAKRLLLSFRWLWIWHRRGTICPASSPRKGAGNWAWAAQNMGRVLEFWDWIMEDQLWLGRVWTKKWNSICLWSSLIQNPSSADIDKNCECVNQSPWISAQLQHDTNTVY